MGLSTYDLSQSCDKFDRNIGNNMITMSSSLPVLEDPKFKFAELMNKCKTLPKLMETIHTLNNKNLEFELEKVIFNTLLANNIDTEKIKTDNNDGIDYLVVCCGYVERLLKTYDHADRDNWPCESDDESRYEELHQCIYESSQFHCDTMCPKEYCFFHEKVSHDEFYTITTLWWYGDQFFKYYETHCVKEWKNCCSYGL